MKRIISVLISVIFIFSSVSVFADSDVNIADEKYAQVLQLMNALGIENKFSGNSYDTVTRGQFVYTLAGFMNIDTEAPTEKCYYADMKDHFANTASVAARDIGIISEAELFYPDEKVTLAQAIKMCMIATGYQIQAGEYGGYPEGYLIAGVLAGHLNSIKAENNDRGLNVYEALVLLYNTLTVDLMKQTMFGDSYKFTKAEGVNLLSEYYSIYEIEGILTRTANSSVDYYSEPAGEGKIAIEDVLFNFDDNCEDLLGYNVSGFYEQYDGVKTLLTVSPKRNKTVHLEGGNFSFNGSILAYSDKNGGNDEDYKINRSYSLIYNGAPYAGNIEQLLTNRATVRLISNNNDRIYDVIFVDIEEYTYVSSVDYENMIIYDSNSPERNLSLIDNGVYYSVFDTKSGSYVDFDFIEEGSLLGIIKSEDGNFVKITAYSDSVMGSVAEYDYTNNCVYLNGETYYISPYFEEYYGEINLGLENEFLLGANDEIVAVVDPATTMEFGVVVNITDNGSVFNLPDIKIFTESGKMLIAKLAKRVMLDNTFVDASVVCDTIAPLGNVKRQLVKYQLNENGEVFRIDTKEAGDLSTSENVYVSDNKNDYDSLTLHRFGEPDASAGGEVPTHGVLPTQTYTYMYKSSPTMFYPKFNIRSSVIFVIPTDANANDDKKYAIATDDVFSDDDEYTDLEVMAYNIDEYGMAEAIVYINDASTAVAPKSSAKSAVVEKITTAFDEYDETVKTKISVWMQGKFYTYYIEDSAVINKTSGNGLCPGDIIRFNYIDNRIVTIIVDFDASPDVFTNNGSVSFNGKNGSIQYQSGLLYSLKDSYAQIDPMVNMLESEYNLDYKNLKHFTVPTTSVLLINMKRDENGIEFDSVQPTTAAELLSYKKVGEKADFIVLRQRYLSPEVMFVYRITDK